MPTSCADSCGDDDDDEDDCLPTMGPGTCDIFCPPGGGCPTQSANPSCQFWDCGGDDDDDEEEEGHPWWWYILEAIRVLGESKGTGDPIYHM